MRLLVLVGMIAGESNLFSQDSSPGSTGFPLSALPANCNDKVTDFCDCGSPPCGTASCCRGRCVDWTGIPGSIHAMARPGNFAIPPKGHGAYSLSDDWAGVQRERPAPSGYSPIAAMPSSFFDADFRYVESLPAGERTLVEHLKRIPLNDCLTFSTGGQVLGRFMNETNSRLSEQQNSYTLGRVRLFGDLMIADRVRLFGEYLWADAFSEELAPGALDVNRGDALNLFVELRLFDDGGHPVFARVGRQELLFGSQRLVSTLDWANTRRTFDGARLFRQGESWDFDLFYTGFVPPDPDGLDQVDDGREFGGGFVTHRPEPGHFHDFYYLFLDHSNTTNQQGIARSPTEVHTFGTRYVGDQDGLLWEYELALQFGDQNGRDLFAGAATAGIGRHFANACMTPTIWLYYDYASGDSDPANGDAHTFNQLFPFGHYYLGWLDQVARQNVHDVNAHLYFYPRPWMTVWLQYHHFWLNHRRDALYNAGGVATRRDPTGAAGNNVGDEIDVVINLHLDRYSDLMVGYSQLFGGGFLEATRGPNLAADAELFHLMYQRKW